MPTVAVPDASGWYKRRMHPSSTVRTDEVAPQPWRNGGGTTRELLARPAGDAWQVRVSVADVVADGPFSAFPNVSRWFAVIDGAGVVVAVDGVEHRCVSGREPLAFAGDADTRSRSIDGPTRDLNLMLRGVRGAMQVVVPGRRVPARDERVRPVRPLCRSRPHERRRRRQSTSRCRRTPFAGGRPRLHRSTFDGAGWWLSADFVSSR